MKKLVLIMSIITFNILIFIPVSAQFPDITTQTLYADAINYAQNNNIVDGYSDGTFKPDNQITRTQFTKIIINSVRSADQISGENCFPDISDGVFAKYICTAKTEGIINGYSDGLFRPDEFITFAQASKIIVLGFGYDTEENSDMWAPFLKILTSRKSIPTSLNSIDQLINRGEMVEIIWRLRENIREKDSKRYIDGGLSSSLSTGRYQPSIGDSWQWQLAGEINTSYDVDMYDIDLFEAPQSVIDTLHARGIKVICYFNGGAYEPYRSDSGRFPNEVLGSIMEDWEDEKWLDISNYAKFSDIMTDRLDLAVSKGCDGVEPDNMAGYTNNSGFPLTYDDQLEYNKWLAAEAHTRGLSIALKNDLDQVAELVSHYDFSVNEQCFYYNECDSLLPFIQAGKPVFGVEYDLSTNQFCTEANNLGFSWLKMEYDLDGGRSSCE